MGAFISAPERPALPVISRGKLAAVPIHPLDKDTLARQLKMEGMMDITTQAATRGNAPATMPVRGGTKTDG